MGVTQATVAILILCNNVSPIHIQVNLPFHSLSVQRT